MQVVRFQCAQDVCAIPVLAVKEFCRPLAVTRVPLADPRIIGIANIRGKCATVLDLRSCFAKPVGEAIAHPRMVLLETNDNLTSEAIKLGIKAPDEPVVLLVDRIIDIITVSTDAIQPRPANISKRFVAGIFRIGTEYIALLDMASLIDQIMQSQEL